MVAAKFLTVFSCRKAMMYRIVLFAFLHINLAIHGSKMVLVQPVPETCTPENEGDIASDDPLVNHMFEAYKVRSSYGYE